LDKYINESVEDYIGKEEGWIKSLRYEKDITYTVYEINDEGRRIDYIKNLVKSKVRGRADLLVETAESLFDRPEIKIALNKNEEDLLENKEEEKKISFIKKILSCNIGDTVDLKNKETTFVGVDNYDYFESAIINNNKFLLNSPESFDIMVRLENKFEKESINNIFKIKDNGKSFYELEDVEKIEILKNIVILLDNKSSLGIINLLEIARKNVVPINENIEKNNGFNTYQNKGSANYKFLKENGIDILKVNELLLNPNITSDLLELKTMLQKEQKLRQSILNNLNENKNRFLELFASENPNAPFKSLLIKDWVDTKEKELPDEQFQKFKNESLILMDYLRDDNKEKNQAAINKLLIEKNIRFLTVIHDPKIKELVNKTKNFLRLSGVDLKDEKTFNVKVNKEEEIMLSFLKSIKPKSGNYNEIDIADVLVKKICKEIKNLKVDNSIKIKKNKPV
jgi:hypothetical protein